MDSSSDRDEGSISPAGPLDDRAPVVSALAGPRTLVSIVEDDPSVRHALRRFLESAGFSVRTCASGQQALQDRLVATAACMIIDIHLGDMDGFELTRSLRATGVTVPFIFITAHDDESTKVSARRAGAVAYLSKPVEAEVLLDAIGRAAHHAA